MLHSLAQLFPIFPQGVGGGCSGYKIVTGAQPYVVVHPNALVICNHVSWGGGGGRMGYSHENEQEFNN